jgi:heat shock protein HtpX
MKGLPMTFAGPSERGRIKGSRSLAVRMVLVAVLNPLIALGLLAVVIAVTPSRWLPGIIFGLIAGAGARVVGSMRRKRPPGRVLGEADDPDLFGILNRLCALADIPKPELVLSDQAQPNSWVTHLPGRAPRLYLTRGLREALTLEELQAVLGHELAHIANRDALVMTTAGAPAAVMVRCNGAAGLDAIPIVAIGILSQLGVTVLSRYRELAADAGSSAITGRPSALASALLKVSDAHAQIPRKDLRAAAALNAFNLVAVPHRSQLLRQVPLLARLTATHPPLRARLDALEALERAQ